MPYRPPQHQIASAAVTCVSRVWASIGASVEEIRQDYGEDLLVQPSFNGKMDAARLWIQVKGAASLARMGKPGQTSKIYVRADTALRWARTADLLVLVHWDVQNDRGWYEIPSLTNDHAMLSRLDRSRFAIEISSEKPFNVESAKTIAWWARLEHLGKFIRTFRMSQLELADQETDDDSWANEAVAEAAIDVMLDLNIITTTGGIPAKININPDFTKAVETAVKQLPEPPPGELHEFVYQAIILAILRTIKDATACPVPHAVLREMTDIARILLGFPTDRAELQELLEKQMSND